MLSKVIVTMKTRRIYLTLFLFPTKFPAYRTKKDPTSMYIRYEIVYTMKTVFLGRLPSSIS